MPVKAQLAVGDYLATTFEHDCEFVHGEVVKRSAPSLWHSDIQGHLCAILWPFRAKHDVYAYPELRMRLAEDLIRIPDVAVFVGRADDVPTTPPLVAIEISSPDDRLSNTLEKFAEYRRWGVPHIWLVESELKTLFVYDGSLNETSAFELPAFGLRIEASTLFA